MTLFTIHTGHCIDVMRQLPAKSMQCIITSPPYWGLRDYGTDAQIWGGRSDCPHTWSDRIADHTPSRPESPLWRSAIAGGAASSAGRGHFCVSCGAWYGELGREPTPELYIDHLVQVFREARRLLRDDGTCWINIGDTYWAGKGSSGHPDPMQQDGKHSVIKPKDLVGIPWMLAFALRADGWWLRSDTIWAKGVSFCPTYSGSVMPESVQDRPVKTHEYLFLFTKSARYYYDVHAVRDKAVSQSKAEGDPEHAAESGRQLRSVWTLNPKPYRGAHFAVMSPRVVEPCVLLSTSPYACPHCGAPWRRVVRDADGAQYHFPRSKIQMAQNGTSGAHGASSVFAAGYTYSRQTIGWEPSCACSDNDGSDQCQVFDPFAGAATTLLVAAQHARRGIGIELNPAYAVIGLQRLHAAANEQQPRAGPVQELLWEA